MCPRIVPFLSLLAAALGPGLAHGAPPVVFDELPISVGEPTGEFNNYFPEAGWNGTDFVALWTDNSAGCGDTYCEWDLRSRAIGDGGELSSPATIDGAQGDQQRAAVALGAAGRFLVAYEDLGDPTGRSIRANELSGNGIPLGSTDYRVSPPGSPGAEAPDVAWGGDSFLCGHLHAGHGSPKDGPHHQGNVGRA